MTCLAALLLVASQKLVTVTFPPTPVPAALKILSDATGLHLKSSPKFKDDVIMARLKNADPNEVMDNLCESLCSRFAQQPDGTFLLVENKAAVTAFIKSEEVERQKNLGHSLVVLKKLADEAKNTPPPNPAKQKDEDGESENFPWDLLAARFALFLGMEELAKLPIGDRYVWAENPTALQAAFPNEFASEIDRARTEWGKFNLSGKPIRIKLEAVRNGIVEEDSDTTYRVEVSVEQITSDGNPMVVANGGISLQNGQAALGLFADLVDETTSKSNPKEHAVELPSEALNIRNAISSETYDWKHIRNLAKYEPLLLAPNNAEPTQWFEGLELISAADALDRNLIGTVNDYINPERNSDADLTPTAIFREYEHDIARNDGRWVVVRAHNRISRISRLTAAAFLKSCIEEGGVSVDAAARWVGESPDINPFYSWIADYIGALFSASFSFGNYLDFEPSPLRFWDSLSLETRETLRKGGQINLNDLSMESHELIRRMVYDDDLDESSNDPTDTLPQGISGGTLSLQLVSSPVFIGWSSRDGMPAGAPVMSATGFGRLLAKPTLRDSIYFQSAATWDQFKMGVNRSYHLRFSFLPGNIQYGAELTETLVPKNSEVLSRLPDDILAEAERVRKLTVNRQNKTQRKGVIPPK